MLKSETQYKLFCITSNWLGCYLIYDFSELFKEANREKERIDLRNLLLLNVSSNNRIDDDRMSQAWMELVGTFTSENFKLEKLLAIENMNQSVIHLLPNTMHSK
jgi:hypothetical protein